MEQRNIKDIYVRLQKDITNISKELEAQELKDGERGSLFPYVEKFKQFQNNVKNKLAEYDKNAEWDKFCIAFYGETNSGKSTIIESLRLAFNEETKRKEQEKFKSMYEDLNRKFPNFEMTLEDYESQTKEFQQDIESLQEKQKNTQSTIQAKEQEHKANKTASFVYRIKSFFKLTALSKEIKAHKQELKSLQNDINIIENKQKQLDKDIKKIEEAMKRLEPYADGRIIHGGIDFTKKVVQYDFIYNSQEFVLLDMPGIEGKEKEVESEIKKAIQKAHCVLYVTGQNHLPQEGTLEKIKSQLKEQTEVWMLYNKRAPSLKNLEGNFLTERDREKINTKMTEVLGEHYQGILPISALIAFCVLSLCLLYRNKKSTDNESELENPKKLKEKFLAQKNTDELLDITQFNAFKVKLCELLNNMPLKIKRSNYKKAKEITMDCINSTKEALETFRKDYNTIENYTQNCIEELHNESEILIAKIKKDMGYLIDKLITESREEIYEFIKTDVSNEEVENKLKVLLEEKVKKLEKKGEEIVKKRQKEFIEEIESILKEYKNRVEILLYELHSIVFNVKLANNAKSDSIVIDTDSGIDVVGLMASIGGIALAVFAKFNLWVLALSIIGALIGFLKSIWALIDSDYKKEQQRKSADETLNKFESKLRKNIDEILKNIADKIKEQIERIKSQLDTQLEKIEQSIENLESTYQSLQNLVTDIKIEGGL